ncbi:MAG: CinA family protein [Oscillospiraceae bacterium]|nr:CinA family protein [Oscillospiraceae bacterium]
MMPEYEQPALEAVNMLKEKGLKVATAESCTAGLLSKLITDIPGSSEIFDGGIVSYSNEVKADLLGVEKQMLDKYGAVSDIVAVEMAKGIREKIKSDIGIGITGIAGPGSDQTNKPVGLVYIALCDGESTVIKKLDDRYSGEDVRERNRENSALAALSLIKKYLQAYPEKADGTLATDEFIEKYHTERRGEYGNIRG